MASELEQRSGKDGRAWLGGLLVLLAALYLVCPLLVGDPPVSRDHPVHLYKAWHFWEVLLASGRFRGWSDFWFMGYPAGELYPPGTDLWVAAAHALTWARLSWPVSYALGFASAFVFCAWSAWRFGRELVGPGAALIGALLFLADPGAVEQGGWHYVVEMGVWAQALAQAFLLLFLVEAWRCLGQPRAGPAVRASLFLAAAVLCHPMSVALLGLALPVMAWLRGTDAGSPRWRGLAHLAAAVLLGLCASAFWLLPMVAHWEWTTGTGYGLDAERGVLLSTRALQGLAAWGWLPPLAALGAWHGIRRGRGGVELLAILGALLIWLSLVPIHELAGLDRLLPFLGKLQYRRFAMAGKVCLFFLAGLGGLAGVRMLLRSRRLAHATPRWGLAMALLALAGSGLWAAWWGVRAAGYPWLQLVTAERSAWWEEMRDVAQFSGERSQEDSRFFRVAWFKSGSDNRAVVLPVFNGLPLYNPAFTPVKLYSNVPHGGYRAALKAMSVRYVVTIDELERSDLQPVAEIGRFAVHEYRGWRPERWTLLGEGRVEPVVFEGEQVELQLSGVEEGAVLRLHVGCYTRGRAFLDGQQVELGCEEAYEPDGPRVLTLPARDGLLRLAYVELPVDRLGRILSVLALAALLGWLAWAAFRSRRNRQGSAVAGGGGFGG